MFENLLIGFLGGMCAVTTILLVRRAVILHRMRRLANKIRKARLGK